MQCGEKSLIDIPCRRKEEKVLIGDLDQIIWDKVLNCEKNMQTLNCIQHEEKILEIYLKIYNWT